MFEIKYKLSALTVTEAVLLWHQVESKIVNEKLDFRGNERLYEMRGELWKRIQIFDSKK